MRMSKMRRRLAWCRDRGRRACTGVALPAQAQDTQYFPLLVYRTGPYGANGAQLANGQIDYLKLINAEGGVNGVMLSWEECETEYKTDVGVECYERLKGNGAVAAVSPFSTGITYALLEKAAADENVLFSMGYGRTSAADGTVFPWVFNFPATYWSQATSIMEYIAEQEGGFDKLAGKKIGLVHLDHPYGREPIPTLEKMAERRRLRAAAVPGADRLDDRPEVDLARHPPRQARLDPDVGLGCDEPDRDQGGVADPLSDGSFHRQLVGGGRGRRARLGRSGRRLHWRYLPRCRRRRAGVRARSARRSTPPATAPEPEDEIGEVLYNRGVANSAFIVEAMNTAMKEFGNKVLTGEEMRWGFEHLDITPERIDELGLTGVIPPTKVTCSNHEGSPAIKLQRWDGEKWTDVHRLDPGDDRSDAAAGRGRCGTVRQGERHHTARLHELRGVAVRDERQALAGTTSAPGPEAAQGLLVVNNIEVVYDHVILVLQGVSLSVPEGGVVALLGANGAGKTTTLKAISNLLRAERGDITKGIDHVCRPGRLDARHRRAGQARRRPGHGGPPLLRASDHRGEPADRRLHPQRRQGRDRRRSRDGVRLFSRGSPSGAAAARATRPAASSR